jgi:hypothetical protein
MCVLFLDAKYVKHWQLRYHSPLQQCNELHSGWKRNFPKENSTTGKTLDNFRIDVEKTIQIAEHQSHQTYSTSVKLKKPFSGRRLIFCNFNWNRFAEPSNMSSVEAKRVNPMRVLTVHEWCDLSINVADWLICVLGGLFRVQCIDYGCLTDVNPSQRTGSFDL